MKRFDVYWVNLDPTIGREIKKMRPAVIVSPDEMNEELDTIIIAPLTTALRNWPTRIFVKLDGKEGEVVLDQIRTVDKIRLKKKIGSLNAAANNQILEKLREIFA
jgi:mRNA interferase MazF